jgi:hypothetical protein
MRRRDAAKFGTYATGGPWANICLAQFGCTFILCAVHLVRRLLHAQIYR